MATVVSYDNLAESLKSRDTVFRTIWDTLAGYGWWLKVIIESMAGSKSKMPAGRERRLVLIASDLPPYVSGGIYRPLSLIEYGIREGWKITAITTAIRDSAPPIGAGLLNLVSKKAEVLRIAPPQLALSYKWYPRVNGNFINALAVFSEAKQHLKNNIPSVIMATGPKFNSFIAAYYLSRYFKAKLVLDYRDEWTECPFKFIENGNVDRVWEERCLRNADLVFFTTESQLRHQMLEFPVLDKKKCHVVPNGWEPVDFVDPTDEDRRSVPTDGKTVISHVGTFGLHIDIVPFFETLKKVLERRPDLREKIIIRLVGTKNDEAVQYLTTFPYRDILEMNDCMPKAASNRIMQKSAALLLFYNGPFERYIPGKLYDYLAAGSPILVFGEKGEACDIIRKFRAGIIISPSDPGALERALDAVVSRGAGSDRDKTGLAQWIALHTREASSLRMLELIKQL